MRGWGEGGTAGAERETESDPRAWEPGWEGRCVVRKKETRGQGDSPRAGRGRRGGELAEEGGAERKEMKY